MPLSSVPLSHRTVVAAVVLTGVVVTVSGCAGGPEGADRSVAEDAPPAAAGTASPGAAAPAVPAAATSAPPAVAGDSPAVPVAPATSRASAVLHRWDRARAAAFAAGDVAALRRLYVPGSAAGRRDVRTLRGYLARGLRVEGIRMQLLAVQVLQERRGWLRLRVTDRLTGAVAVGPQGRVRLPSDTASTRVVDLVRRGGWRVAAVSAPGST